MSALVAAPLAIPLGAAAAGFVAHRHPRVQAFFSVAASIALAVVGGILLGVVEREGVAVTRIGGWPFANGVAFVADRLSAVMLLATAALGLATVTYGVASLDRRRSDFFHPLTQVLLGGACGAILTADLFNLFVWLEVMLMASFVLVALGGRRGQLAGAMKYVAISLMASTFLLVGVGLVYGLTGSLAFAHIASMLGDGAPDGPWTAAAFLTLGALGVKAAVFPVFFWLPASYPTPPPVVSALFAGLLTKVGVYALLRCATALFADEAQAVAGPLAFVAGATMLTGVLGAAAQKELRRILSFHIVSQIGYMVMGLAIGGVRGVGGAVFFVLHNMAAKTALFLAAGVVERERGTGKLAELGGLARERPLVAGLFLIPALSLAGLPPLSGFVGKLVLVDAGLRAERWAVTGVALAVSLLTLYSMVKIWLGAFWSPRPEGRPKRAETARAPMLGALAFLAAGTVLLGVAAEPALDLCLTAAADVLDREAWAARVMAAGGAP